MKALAGAAAGGRQRGTWACPGRPPRAGRASVRARPTFGTIRKGRYGGVRTRRTQLNLSYCPWAKGNPEIVGFYCHLSAMFILSRAVLIK